MLTKSEFAPETQRKIFYLLKSIFDSAVNWQMIHYTPCVNIQLSEIKKKKDREILTPEQVSTFFKNQIVKDSKYYVMLIISFSLGMRPGDA
jgi:hypothetical protein